MTWTEYRVIFRVPAGVLASREDRDRGHVECHTSPHKTPDGAKREARARGGDLIRVEMRNVTATDWKE